MSVHHWPTDDITLIYKSDRRGTRISIRNDQYIFSNKYYSVVWANEMHC